MQNVLLIMVLIAVTVGGAELVRLTVRRALAQPVAARSVLDDREPVVAGAVDVD